MTPLEIRDQIITELDANFTEVEIAWPNKIFDPSEYSEFIRPTILMGASSLKELGEMGVGERTGVLVVDIFTEKDTGNRRAMELAADIEILFRRADLEGVIFDEPQTEEIGQEANSIFYHTKVQIPFNTFIGEGNEYGLIITEEEEDLWETEDGDLILYD